MSLTILAQRLLEIAEHFELESPRSCTAVQLRSDVELLHVLDEGGSTLADQEIRKELDELEDSLSHVRGLQDVYLDHIDKETWDALLLEAWEALVAFRREIQI